MNLSRRGMFLGLAATGLSLARPAHAFQQVTGGRAFGSTWRVVSDQSVDMHRIKTTVEAIIEQIDRQMSPYLAGSDLRRFNATATTAPQHMPLALCQVTTAALDIAERTNGAFDPTVGPIVERYGFGPIKGDHGHCRDISTGSIGGTTITKSAPHATLDLCGIAKGYALDQIVAALSAGGVESALVEMGGEVQAIGTHPNGRAWQVAISDPFAATFKTQRVITPKHLALATSGHAANGVFGPVSISHIIDPSAGRPASTQLASVSVLAPNAMEADALATALCASGAEAGIVLARRLKVAALFITDSTFAPQEVMTGAFENHVLL